MKLSENLKFGILVVIVIASIVVQCYYSGPSLTERTRVFYDCRMSEISPDVPPLIKEECRKMQKEKK